MGADELVRRKPQTSLRDDQIRAASARRPDRQRVSQAASAPCLPVAPGKPYRGKEEQNTAFVNNRAHHPTFGGALLQPVGPFGDSCVKSTR